MEGLVTAIFLVRAGRTSLGERGAFEGRLDHDLTEAGRVDAMSAAARLEATGVDRVYTSPLLRARRTAHTIARRLGVPTSVVDHLVDVDVGSWGGLTPEEIARVDPEAYRSFFRFPIATTFAGGEAMVEVDRRMLAALGAIGRASRRQVAVVTHELPIRRVLVRVKRAEGTAMWDPTVPPGCVVELRWDGDRLELPTVLEDLFRSASRASRSAP
jgi:broad specificity phosphatase PhoE